MVEMRGARGNTAVSQPSQVAWFSQVFSNKDNVIHEADFKNRSTWAF